MTQKATAAQRNGTKEALDYEALALHARQSRAEKCAAEANQVYVKHGCELVTEVFLGKNDQGVEQWVPLNLIVALQSRVSVRPK